MELAFKLVTRRRLNVALCLHTPLPVPQSEWDIAIAQFAKLGDGGVLDPERTRMLVITDGGAPDAKQRAQLSELWRGSAVKVAALVPGMTNPIKRGVMTALSWINPAVVFYTPQELSAALLHVDLDGELPGLWPEFLALQKKLQPVRMLERIAKVAQLPL